MLQDFAATGDGFCLVREQCWLNGDRLFSSSNDTI
jgi:hypothetical protein